MDSDELDTKRVIEAIRRNLKTRIEDASALPTPVTPAALSIEPPPPEPEFIAEDLSVLREAFDIGHTRLKSHRRLVGWAVILLKKLVRQLMMPALEQQVAYNAATVRLLEALNGRVGEAGTELHRRTAELAHRTDALQAEGAARSAEFNRGVAALQAELDRRTLTLQGELDRRTLMLQAELDRRTLTLQAEAGRLTQEEQKTAALDTKLGHALVELQATREQVARAERKLRRILHTLASRAEKSQELAESAAEARSGPSNGRAHSEFDYAGFEERFRGSEAEIKRRHRGYLRHMNNGPVLDIGCGRGEFLELLRESGIEARGVDLDLDMILLCRDKGLEVWHGDAFAYLDDVPDGSLGGIFSAQFIEHFPPNDIIRLTHVCHRKLKPRGVLLFETVNPSCLTVFARSFFLDPSHVWPFHAETLRFLFEAEGFREISVEFASPVDPSTTLPHLDTSAVGADAPRFNRCVDLLNELVFGYQDFAIVGRKHFTEAVADSIAGRD